MVHVLELFRILFLEFRISRRFNEGSYILSRIHKLTACKLVNEAMWISVYLNYVSMTHCALQNGRKIC